MRRVYRLTRLAFAANPFDGEGSYLFGGRWSSVGTRMAYAAEHLSLAMLEYLAHLDPNRVPDDLVLAQAEIPERVSRIRITATHLPASWTHYPAPAELARMGDRFISRAKAAILILPSVLAPTEENWLLNPLQRDFKFIRILPIEPFRYDRRLVSSAVSEPKATSREKRSRQTPRKPS